jgi:hypothetical protein
VNGTLGARKMGEVDWIDHGVWQTAMCWDGGLIKLPVRRTIIRIRGTDDAVYSGQRVREGLFRHWLRKRDSSLSKLAEKAR